MERKYKKGRERREKEENLSIAHDELRVFDELLDYGEDVIPTA